MFPHTLLQLIQLPASRDIAVKLPESGIRISYHSLREQVSAMAEALASIGIGRNDRVAIVLPNGLPAVVCLLGGAVAGTAAPLNPGYRQDEFIFLLRDIGAKVLLCPQNGGEAARKAAGASGLPVYSVSMDSSGFVRLAGAPRGKSPAPPTTDDIALVLHTSGSTGRPKRVAFFHHNIAASIDNIATHYGLCPRDATVCVMPLFHIHGLVGSVLATFRSGGTVAVPEKFNPVSFWRTVRDSGATWYSAVPTIHNLLLSRAHDRPAGAERLRFIRSCSAALPAEMMAKMEKSFGVPVLEAYGMTEASHQMASNPLPPRVRKPASVGVATGVQIAIMDGAGNLLPNGKPGEVVIQGPSVVCSYEGNAEANAISFTNGWFRTGDQGVLDPDGYLAITGRIKELINRGGEKIGPREVDEVLLAHPAIAEAVAFGIPHPTWGEEVVAAVVLKEPQPEAAILAFCKERLADFKVPKRLFVVTTMPRTATGKILRGSVAEALRGKGTVHRQ